MENFYRAQSTFFDTFTTAQNKNKNNNNHNVVDNKIYTNGTNLVLPHNSNHPPPPISTTSPQPGAVTMNESKARTTTTTKHKPSSSRSKSRFDSRNMDIRKRIATYKLYSAEGQMKRSFKKGICWIKGRYSKIVYGF